MIGDSITNNYDKSRPPDENFLPTWQQFYAPRKALNLGFSGDTTAHVLWRINHGEVDGLHPKVAIVLIGTNNTGHGDTAEETETGIDAVITELENRLPETISCCLAFCRARSPTTKRSAIMPSTAIWQPATPKTRRSHIWISDHLFLERNA